MLDENRRAFKEWTLSCAAIRRGRQTILIRKGGIREDDGVFRVNDSEFFLLPTFEHQNAELLQEEFAEELAGTQRNAPTSATVRIDTYAMVNAVWTCDDEDILSGLAGEHPFNSRYIKMRLDFNPYDPLYVIMLRAYRLPQATTLPVIPVYSGCRSWIDLERPLSTLGAVASIEESEFIARRRSLVGLLGEPKPQ